MNTTGLGDKLRERLALLLEIEPSSIQDSELFADLGVDSMMRLELVALVEQHVGQEIPERDLPAMQTIGDVLHYVQSAA